MIKPMGLLQAVQNSAPTLKKLGFKIPDAQSERAKMLEEKGLLIEHGAACWDDEPEPRAYVGDLVVVSKWCGTLITGNDDETYRMINADDVYCVYEPKESQVDEEAA